MFSSTDCFVSFHLMDLIWGVCGGTMRRIPAAAVGTPVPAGASSGGREGGFGVAVDRLDQWGVTTQETFLVARFGRGEFGRQQSRQVITAARPEFIKLRVRPLGVLPVPAPRYVLTVGAADGK